MSMGIIESGEYNKVAGNSDNDARIEEELESQVTELETKLTELTTVKTITPTKVTGGAGGTVTWDSFNVRKCGKMVSICINNMRHSTTVTSVGSIALVTGLPKPATSRLYLNGMTYGPNGENVNAYIDNAGNLGIDIGFVSAEAKLYGSCSYICTN